MSGVFVKPAETLGAADYPRLKRFQLEGRRWPRWHKEGYELNLAKIWLGTELVLCFFEMIQRALRSALLEAG